MKIKGARQKIKKKRIGRCCFLVFFLIVKLFHLTNLISRISVVRTIWHLSFSIFYIALAFRARRAI